MLILESGSGAAPALARALTRTYPSWAVAAVDPAAAVDALTAGDVDIVVPIGVGGNGPALVEWLRRQYPSLSQVTADVERLQGGGDDIDRHVAESVGRTLVLRDQLQDFDLVALAAEMKRIPVISQVYRELTRMLAFDPVVGDYSLADVADLVGRDPGIAARVLKLINSAVFGLPRSVTNIPQAVALLGAKRISTMLLWVSLSDQLRAEGPAAGMVEPDWEAARRVAELARRIAAAEGFPHDEAETAYLAGLLHNVGRLLLAANMPEQFAAAEWPETVAARLDSEKERLGARHTDLGALLIRFWGLDDVLAETVGFYACPSAGASRSIGPLAIVHASAVLTGSVRLDWDREFLAQAGLADHVAKWEKKFGQ